MPTKTEITPPMSGNLSAQGEVAAEDGVYASWAEVDGVRYRAMSNLGCNPSVGGCERRLETHLFGFGGSLYGRGGGGFLRAVLAAHGHQTGHLVFGNRDLLASPFGQRHVGDLVGQCKEFFSQFALVRKLTENI